MAKLVKTGLVLALLLAPVLLRAEEPRATPEPRRNPFFGTPLQVPNGAQDLSATPKAITAELPPIQARRFGVRVVQASHSDTLYVLEADVNDLPLIGHIILLKSGDAPVMAFRVLRTYPGTRRFIGRKVRRYGDYLHLDLDSRFDALEKIKDLAPPPPAPKTTVQEDQEIQDLESDEGLMPGPESIPSPSPSGPPVTDLDATPQLPTPEPSPELEASPEASPEAQPSAESSDNELEDLERSLDQAPAPETAATPEPEATPETEASPEPEAAPEPEATPHAEPSADSPSAATDADGDAETDRSLALTIQEVEPMDRSNHGVSLEFGTFRNFSAGGSSTAYFQGGGLRYAFTPFHMVFASSRKTQDSISFEGGMFFYKALNYGDANTAITVMPLIGTVRYNLLFSSNLGVFLYGGGMRNQVIGSVQATANAINRLSSVLPAFGGGMTFRVGPGWELRFDTGTDMIGAGLMLRF